MAIYEGEWEGGYDKMVSAEGYYWEDKSNQFPRADDIIYACYNSCDYEGEALVVFQRDGKLFEVNSSHCSCNGLFWEEEETSIDALRMRKTGWSGVGQRLNEALDIYEKGRV